MKIAALAAMVGFSLSILFPAHATHTHDGRDQAKKFTKHFNESLFAITDNREFSIEIILDEKEYKIGKNVIGIVIHDKNDEDVESADIKIAQSKPDGQVIAGSPVIKEKGDGLYTVENLDLGKEGRWELAVSVRKKKIEDKAIFVFPDVMKERMSSGKYGADDEKKGGH